ncbi:MAG: 23S rRNA (adenine(1618)-N(6))-methyltransferase RlmF [Bacteroidota bacterium]
MHLYFCLAKHKNKAEMHPRNRHKGGYDFDQLTERWPQLKSFLTKNKKGLPTINFHNDHAVKCLNQALLITHYQLDYWDIPDQYLCPAVPGRADYAHHLADLLASTNRGKVPRGKHIRCLDLGTGANLIYPIIGSKEYGWTFVGSDIDDTALASAQKIIDQNERLTAIVSLRFQQNRKAILDHLLQKGEYFDLVCCNPPFYSSAQEAQAENERKRKGLGAPPKAKRNFGGQANELWHPGGERAFVGQLIQESSSYPTQCYWYTTLVARDANLKPLEKLLGRVPITERRVIPMAQGNKTSRILAWTFLSKKQQQAWQGARW